VSQRPLVFVSGLTVGDYLLWNWSLGGNHDVLALVAGLTLPPLAVATLWLLALTIARLIARTASRPAAHAGRRAVRGASSAKARRRTRARRRTAPAVATRADAPQPVSASSDRPPRKLAA
jgi:hypothetical protein